MDQTAGETGPSLPRTGIDRNKSAFELYSVDSEKAPPLRKISSVANYNTVDSQQNHSGSLLSSALGFVTGNNSSTHSHSTTHEDEGLTMNVRSAFGPSVLQSSVGVLGSAGHHEELSLPSGTPPDANSSTGTLNRVKSGMFGMLNRGFFAKPVMCSPEESYRYIMTMDR